MRWPFKKKAEKTNVNSIADQPILNNSGLASFQIIGGNSVSWLKTLSGNQNDFLLIDYFNSLSEVSAPIFKYSDNAKNIKPYFVSKKDGKELENHPLEKIILDFWQNEGELMTIYYLLLGNAYIAAFEAGTFQTLGAKIPTKFYLLPTEYTKIKVSESTNIDIRDYKAEGYLFKANGKFKDINIDNPELVLHLKNKSVFKDCEIAGLSKLVPCEKNMQSLASGYGAKISLYDNGPRVIITGKAQGEFGSINSDEDTQEISKKINDTYGRTKGQQQIAITKTPLDVTMISLNVRDLMINEMNSSDFRRICNVFQQDSKIHGDPDSTTYDNMDTAFSDFYNNPFKSLYDNIAEKLTEFINKWHPDVKILLDYSKIKYIAEFEKKQEEELFLKVEQGLMTRNEYLQEIGRNTVNLKEFNEYYTYYNGTWTNVSGQKEVVSEGNEGIAV